MSLIAISLLLLAAMAKDTGFAIAAATCIVYLARNYPNGGGATTDSSGYFDGVVGEARSPPVLTAEPLRRAA